MHGMLAHRHTPAHTHSNLQLYTHAREKHVFENLRGSERYDFDFKIANRAPRITCLTCSTFLSLTASFFLLLLSASCMGCVTYVSGLRAWRACVVVLWLLCNITLDFKDLKKYWLKDSRSWYFALQIGFFFFQFLYAF